MKDEVDKLEPAESSTRNLEKGSSSQVINSVKCYRGRGILETDQWAADLYTWQQRRRENRTWCWLERKNSVEGVLLAMRLVHAKKDIFSQETGNCFHTQENQ